MFIQSEAFVHSRWIATPLIQSLSLSISFWEQEVKQIVEEAREIVINVCIRLFEINKYTQAQSTTQASVIDCN